MILILLGGSGRDPAASLRAEGLQQYIADAVAIFRAGH
jgi:hypothetical protein